jgi:hypothetical protein
MSTLDEQDHLKLRRWFFDELRRRGIDHEKETPSYDANTAYDYAYYRLQAEAKVAWLKRYGYAPSDEMLSRAFFDAEIERFSRDRHWRKPLMWLRRRLLQLKR